MGFQPDPSTKSVSTYSNPIAVSDSDVHNSPLKALTAQDTANYQAQLQKIDSDAKSQPKAPPALPTVKEMKPSPWSTSTNSRSKPKENE
jgi:hypothetical protein